MKKVIASICLAAIVSATLFTGVALAGWQYTGSGLWHWGISWNPFGYDTVYSNYQDWSLTHSASVKDGWGVYTRSGWISAGTTARASSAAHPDKLDEAFYNRKDIV